MQHIVGCMRRPMEKAVYDEFRNTMPKFEWKESLVLVVTYNYERRGFLTNWWRSYKKDGRNALAELQIGDASTLS